MFKVFRVFKVFPVFRMFKGQLKVQRWFFWGGIGGCCGGCFGSVVEVFFGREVLGRGKGGVLGGEKGRCFGRGVF